METIGIMMVIVSVAAIAYMLVTHELMRRDKRKKNQYRSCASCKYFERTKGSEIFGKCTYFFKSFRAWENACHRYENKGGSYED